LFGLNVPSHSFRDSLELLLNSKLDELPLLEDNASSLELLLCSKLDELPLLEDNASSLELLLNSKLDELPPLEDDVPSLDKIPPTVPGFGKESKVSMLLQFARTIA
jgi:hypothetical protein